MPCSARGQQATAAPAHSGPGRPARPLSAALGGKRPSAGCGPPAASQPHRERGRLAVTGAPGLESDFLERAGARLCPGHSPPATLRGWPLPGHTPTRASDAMDPAGASQGPRAGHTLCTCVSGFLPRVLAYLCDSLPLVYILPRSFTFKNAKLTARVWVSIGLQRAPGGVCVHATWLLPTSLLPPSWLVSLGGGGALKGEKSCVRSCR